MALPAALSRPPQTAKREAFEALRERLRSSDMSPAAPRLPSAIPDLDRALGGGFPRGTLATLEGAQSSGRWAIVARLLAQATRRGLGAIVDAGALYPPDLVAAGVALERLLIVPAATPLIVARAADVLLRSRACAVIALAAPSLRATMWRRLAGLARKSGALLLVVATQPSPELQAAAGVRVRCERNRGVTCLR
jgi:cell division inhibitor SulA/protein ImuA